VTLRETQFPSTGQEGVLGGWSNPSFKATPEGGGSKVTQDPKGNQVSITVGIRLRLTSNFKVEHIEVLRSLVPRAKEEWEFEKHYQDRLTLYYIEQVLVFRITDIPRMILIRIAHLELKHTRRYYQRHEAKTETGLECQLLILR
jgi:hypothetical protein